MEPSSVDAHKDLRMINGHLPTDCGELHHHEPPSPQPDPRMINGHMPTDCGEILFSYVPPIPTSPLPTATSTDFPPIPSTPPPTPSTPPPLYPKQRRQECWEIPSPSSSSNNLPLGAGGPAPPITPLGLGTGRPGLPNKGPTLLNKVAPSTGNKGAMWSLAGNVKKGVATPRRSLSFTAGLNPNETMVVDGPAAAHRNKFLQNRAKFDAGIPEFTNKSQQAKRFEIELKALKLGGNRLGETWQKNSNKDEESHNIQAHSPAQSRHAQKHRASLSRYGLCCDGHLETQISPESAQYCEAKVFLPPTYSGGPSSESANVNEVGGAWGEIPEST